MDASGSYAGRSPAGDGGSAPPLSARLHE